MFDVDGAIERWRTHLERQKGISETDQTEMEAHLREEIEELIDSGQSPREAYFKAVHNFGNGAELARQFRKVNWEENYSRQFQAQPALLGNYLKVAFRNLLKHKVYSAINISGLAIGMACCALILLYVQHELKYDTIHSKGDQIYRVLRETKNDDGTHTIGSGISGPFAPALLKDFPEVEDVVRVTSTVARFVQSGDTQFGHGLEDILAAESNFFNVFDFEMITGDRETALVVLHKNIDATKTEAKLPDFIAQYMTQEVQERNTYHLQPLNRVHLYSQQNLSGIAMVYGNIQSIYLFSAIAFLIMLIACVNFVNLATARSTNRAKEIGMRKVSGAHRSQIIRQFLGETILLSSLSFVLAFILAELALPSFNAFVGKNLIPERNIYQLLTLPGLVIFIGLISGIYPAFFLSAFEPIVALKGPLKGSIKGALLRRGLVVFQFSISILLIISTTMVYRQLGFMQNKNLRFQKSHLINMSLFWFDMQKKRNGPENLLLANRYNTVKEVFLAHPNVLKATAYHAPLGTLGGKQFEVRNESDEAFQVMLQQADEDFLETLDIDLLAGRTFHKSEMMGEQNNILLNEAAVEMFGWEDPIGKHLLAGGGTTVTVIGVVKNFHYQSLYENIKPLVIWKNPESFWELSVRVKSEDLPETLAFLEHTWKQFLPDRPFEFRFMDRELDQLYREDLQIGQIVGTFALLAIAVACLGLFGLAAFTAEQRTKEIGVRKILGASVSSIMLLLSTEFAKLLLIANLIAWPVAYFMVGDWLQNFAYRANLSWWVFALGGVIALLIALGTVGYQAWRAALSNPIQALRCE